MRLALLAQELQTIASELKLSDRDTNQQIFREFRKLVRSEGWDIIQRGGSAQLTKRGAKVGLIYKYVGPVYIELKCLISVESDLSSGEIYLRPSHTTSFVKTLSHMYGKRNPYIENWVWEEDGESMPVYKNRQFWPDVKEMGRHVDLEPISVPFVGTSPTPGDVNKVFDHFRHNQEHWVRAVERMLEAHPHMVQVA